MEFKVEIKGVEQLVSNLNRYPAISAPILQRALSAAQAVLAKNTVKGVVPWRTGFLTQSFRAELSNLMLKWFPTASYAPYVEFGTRPHKIVPKNAGALYWPGAAHPVMSVNHPGTRPNAFMERILDQSKDEIDNVFIAALTKINAEIARA